MLFSDLLGDNTGQDLVAFDFETATTRLESACSLAVAVISAEGEIKETKYWLIKPPYNSYNPRNIQIHGIRPTDTANAPSFKELWPDIAPYFQNRTMVAHYAIFDTNVLGACLDAENMTAPDCLICCSCIAARRAFPHFPNHKLPTVCQYLGIELVNHHNALDDAVACANIAHMLRQTGLFAMSWDEAINYSTYNKHFNKKHSS